MTPDELLALGRQLRDVRLERELSLQDVEAATKIRVRFLESIEAGQFDPALTEVQTRGFVRNYATYLQLDLDAMLTAYRQAAGSRRKTLFNLRRVDSTPTEVPIIPIRKSGTSTTPPHPIQKVPTPITSQEVQAVSENSQSRWLIGVLAVGFLLVIGLLAIIAVLIGMDGGDNAQTTEEAIAPLIIATDTPLAVDLSGKGETPAPVATTTPSPTPSPTSTTAGVLVRPPDQINMTGANSIAIMVSATQRSWVRLIVDGTVEYEGLLRPGTALNYQGTQSVTLRTANAGGLQVVINNQDLGILGGRGELYEQSFSLDGVSLTPVAPIVIPDPNAAPITQDQFSGAPVLPDGSLGDPNSLPAELPTAIPTDLPAEEAPLDSPPEEAPS